MWTRQHKRRKSGRLILPLLAAAFLGYFGYHAFEGEYGLKNKAQLEAQVAQLSQELAETTALRRRLEARNKLLHDGTIEKDMLDEQVRRQLGRVGPDEIVILAGPNG
ncbi:MAG: septum formation initiator family protein [Zhengella sp.]|uniref:FtsB family cell division protein n=1 Tax=Zhengella sp. TaxID=2282762 RepID=UPI001DB78F3A|nr:septum formation initiator family protein [Notoacmeibacter sp.]MCC0027925.1 septum formation initiator family protein [Brucellaceae bacterium]